MKITIMESEKTEQTAEAGAAAQGAREEVTRADGRTNRRRRGKAPGTAAAAGEHAAGRAGGDLFAALTRGRHAAAGTALEALAAEGIASAKPPNRGETLLSTTIAVPAAPQDCSAFRSLEGPSCPAAG